MENSVVPVVLALLVYVKRLVIVEVSPKAVAVVVVNIIAADNEIGGVKELGATGFPILVLLVFVVVAGAFVPFA